MQTTLLLLVSFLTVSAISAQDTPPIAEQPVTPTFEAELLGKFSGRERVNLFVEIDKKGHVKDVEAFGPWLTCGKDDPVADAVQAAAVEAARKIVFAPAKRNGDPIEDSVAMSYFADGTGAPPAPRDSKAQVRGAVVNGTSISKPQPKVSSKAKKFGAQGAVTISVVLDEQGKPMTARAKSGHPLLLENAAKAACEARWTPTLLAGQPVKVSASITYNFMP